MRLHDVARDAAGQLVDMLGAISAGEMTATAGTLTRIETAIVALRDVARYAP